jgi:hypothetical protein
MSTIGESFKAAREAKGLSLSEAGRATRIKTQQLEALERDDFRGIPAPTYARGFIKLYAQYLHIDPAPLIDQYNARISKPAPPPPPPTTPGKVLPRVAGKPAYGNRPTSIDPVPANEESVSPATTAPKESQPPPNEGFAPILPVGGLAAREAEPDEPGAEPAISAPVSEQAVSDTVNVQLEAEDPAIAPPSAPVESSSSFWSISNQPSSSIDSAPAVQSILDSPSGFPETSTPSAVRTERNVEGEIEAVETFNSPPKPAVSDGGHDDHVQRARLRQAMLVVIAALILVGVIWLIRKLTHDAAPRGSDLSGSNRRITTLIAEPPEPYLEGR